MMKGTFQINYRKEAIKEIIKLRKRLKGASKVSHTSLQTGLASRGCITLAWAWTKIKINVQKILSCKISGSIDLIYICHDSQCMIGDDF